MQALGRGFSTNTLETDAGPTRSRLSVHESTRSPSPFTGSPGVNDLLNRSCTSTLVGRSIHILDSYLHSGSHSSSLKFTPPRHSNPARRRGRRGVRGSARP